jgi:threonine/homoserine/homoserine lactone efflux protein
MSLFSQVMNNGNNTWVLLGYGIFISAAHLIWFLLIVQFCSTPSIRNKILEKQIFLNKGIGLLLGLLGVSLIFSQI